MSSAEHIQNIINKAPGILEEVSDILLEVGPLASLIQIAAEGPGSGMKAAIEAGGMEALMMYVENEHHTIELAATVALCYLAISNPDALKYARTEQALNEFKIVQQQREKKAKAEEKKS